MHPDRRPIQLRPGHEEPSIAQPKRLQDQREFLLKDSVAHGGAAEDESPAHMTVDVQERIFIVLLPFRYDLVAHQSRVPTRELFLVHLGRDSKEQLTRRVGVSQGITPGDQRSPRHAACRELDM